jgi:hypothetical protein
LTDDNSLSIGAVSHYHNDIDVNIAFIYEAIFNEDGNYMTTEITLVNLDNN